MVLERGSKPLHVAIAEQLAAAIASGQLAPGTRLPPERHLAESLGVSRMTVRQALGELERDGLLRRVVGRAGGTFVLERGRRPRMPTAAAGLSAELRRQGGASGVEPISAEVEPAGRRAAAALGLEAERARRRDHAPASRRRQAARGRAVVAARAPLPRHRGHGSRRLAVRPDGRRLRPAPGAGRRAARARRGAAVRRPRARRQAGRAAPPRRARRLRRRRDGGRVLARPVPRRPHAARDRIDAGRQSEIQRPRGRDRRRRRRLLDPLLADAARLGRRRPRRAGRPDERLDVPLRRARRPAAQLARADADDDELGRALPHARGGGRPRDGLARGRLAAARLLARAAGGDHAPGRLGEDVRPAARARSRRPRRRRSSRRCRPTACSGRPTCRATATSTRASSRSRSPRARAAAAPRSTRTRG